MLTNILTVKMKKIYIQSSLIAFSAILLMFCHSITPISMRDYISYIHVLDVKDTALCTSYLDLILDIDKDGRLQTRISNKLVNFKFPIVNFTFLSNNKSTQHKI